MKDFFKRIGRGIKKVGREIGDFFDSKVGKIIGGVMLAVALPQIFSSFFSGTTTTGARGTLTQKSVEGVTLGGANKVPLAISEVGKPYIPPISKEGYLATASQVKSATDAVTLGHRFKAAALQMGEIFTSPRDATKRTFDFMTGNKFNKFAGDFKVAEGWKGTSFAKPETKNITTAWKGSNNDVVSFRNSVFSDTEIQEMNAQLVEDGVINITPGSSKTDILKGAVEVTPESIVDAAGESISNETMAHLHIDRGISPIGKEKLFQQKGYRKSFEETTGLTGQTEKLVGQTKRLGFKPADVSSRGVTRHRTFFEAPSLVDKALWLKNRSIGEVTGYAGTLSEQPALSSVAVTYGAGKSILAKDERPKSLSYNPYASREASKNLEMGSSFITSTQTPDNLYAQLNSNSSLSEASSIIKNAHQNAGYSYVYGAYAPVNQLVG